MAGAGEMGITEKPCVAPDQAMNKNERPAGLKFSQPEEN